MDDILSPEEFEGLPGVVRAWPSYEGVTSTALDEMPALCNSRAQQSAKIQRIRVALDNGWVASVLKGEILSSAITRWVYGSSIPPYARDVYEVGVGRWSGDEPKEAGWWLTEENPHGGLNWRSLTRGGLSAVLDIMATWPDAAVWQSKFQSDASSSFGDEE